MEEMLEKNQVLSQQVNELREQFGNLWQQHSQLLQTQQLQQQQQPFLPQRLQSKSLKPIRPSVFKGTEKSSKVDDWLYQINAYFDLLQEQDEATKIQYAASLLEEHAARWYRLRVQSNSFSSWKEFQDSILEFFRPVNATKLARDKLANLVQTTTVQNYVQKFTELCLEIPDLGEVEQLDRFVRGLRLEVRREVDLHEPQTFQEAAKIAERWDSIAGQRFGMGMKKPFRPSYPFRSGERSQPKNWSKPQPMEVDTVSTRKNNDNNKNSNKFRSRRPMVCYFCQQSGHPIWECPELQKLRKDLGNLASPTTKK